MHSAWHALGIRCCLTRACCRHVHALARVGAAPAAALTLMRAAQARARTLLQLPLLDGCEQADIHALAHAARGESCPPRRALPRASTHARTAVGLHRL